MYNVFIPDFFDTYIYIYIYYTISKNVITINVQIIDNLAFFMKMYI